uniref:MLO1 n=1 Tax=Solanum tuberosum TaxID=4113 RepID=M1A376_SOLTU
MASLEVVTELRHINVGNFANEENLTNGWDDTFDCYYINEDQWLLEKRKKPLYEALEKIKAELMLLGFLSLLLTVLQEPVSNLCVPKSIGYSWHPCKPKADAQSEYEVTSCDKKMRKWRACKVCS